MQCAELGKDQQGWEDLPLQPGVDLERSRAGQTCGPGGLEDGRHRQEMVKKQAGVGLPPQGRPLMDRYPLHPPQGLMGENLLGLPDSC